MADGTEDIMQREGLARGALVGVAEDVTWRRCAGAVSATAAAMARICWLPVLALWLMLPIGCAAPRTAVARPVVIGASVSAGYQSLATRPSAASDEAPSATNFGHAIDACLTITHGQTKVLADRAMVFDAVGSLERQVAAARALRPTTVFAVDALFWAAYAPAASRDERRSRMDRALAVLASVEALVVIGNLPDMRAVVGGALGPTAMVSEVERADLNRRIASWAEGQPQVTLLAIDQLVDDVRARESIDLGRTQVDARDVDGLLANDGLHLTTDGQVALATLALSSLAARGFLAPADIRSDLVASRQIADSLAQKERAQSAERPSIEREKRYLAVVAETDAAVASGDVEAVALSFERRFSPEWAALRRQADLIDVELAKGQMPSLVDAIRPRITSRAAAALQSGGNVESLVSALEFSLAFREHTSARAVALALAPLVAADQVDGKSPDVPTANGYALRIYEWFVADAPAVVAACYSDALRTAQELHERSSSDQARFAFARDAGFTDSRLPDVRSPDDELRRFVVALRADGRMRDAGAVERAWKLAPVGQAGAERSAESP